MCSECQKRTTNYQYSKSKKSWGTYMLNKCQCIINVIKNCNSCLKLCERIVDVQIQLVNLDYSSPGPN